MEISSIIISAAVLDNTISLSVSVPEGTGATIMVVYITEGVLPDLDHLEVKLDDQIVERETDIAGFFSLEETTEPTWIQWSFEGETYALVKTHFSDHTITISSLIETIGGITAIFMYGIICIIVGLVFASPMIFWFVTKVYF